MRKYAADQERMVRVKRLVAEWRRSRLITVAQQERLAADLEIGLRQTNQFLRFTLLAFGLLIVAAAVALVLVTLNFSARPSGAICLAAAAAAFGGAEFLTGRLRLYRFGLEEACAVAAAVLVAVGAALLTGPLATGAAGDRQLVVALLAGAAASFAVYLRFGYVYAAVGALACAGLAAFQLALTRPARHITAAAILTVCFAAARVRRRAAGDEFPGDEYEKIQAAAFVGIYAVLNLQLSSPLSAAPEQFGWFYWVTYPLVWLLPALGLWWSVRERDRLLLDASLVVAVTTLVTNKSYLGLDRKSFDPILLGAFLIGTAFAVRRWLAAGPGGARHGVTASRLLRSDKDRVTLAGLASAALPSHQSQPRHVGHEPFDGGRSGGGGGGASY